MKNAARVLTVCASAIITLVLPCKVSAQEGGAGIVEEIRGTVFWRQHANAKPSKLDSMSDAARRLYPGEQVRCARKSSLRLRLGRKIKIIRGRSAWFTIPPAASVQSDPIQRMLDDYGGLGGRDRGDSSQVFSPSDHSMAMPEKFVIRWIPSAAGCTLSLIIQDVVGVKLWRQDDVDGALGSLDSDAARQALINYRAKSGQGPLTLRLDDSCGSQNEVSFLLLSVRSEQSLKQDLAFWNREHGVFTPHLGRASVFSRYGMFSQAAEEYEAALGAAPNSTNLLVRTILAHRQTGNFIRAKALEKRLPARISIP